MSKDFNIEEEKLENIKKSIPNIDLNKLCGRIAPTAKISSPMKKIKEPKEAFKALLIKGLNAQICLAHSDIIGRDTRINQRRWYFKTEDKKNWYVCLKYQNRSIPFLPNNSTSFVVSTLQEVEQIYTNLLKEVESNDDFINYLFNLTKTLNIAKGRYKSE